MPTSAEKGAARALTQMRGTPRKTTPMPRGSPRSPPKAHAQLLQHMVAGLREMAATPRRRKSSSPKK